MIVWLGLSFPVLKAANVFLMTNYSEVGSFSRKIQAISATINSSEKTNEQTKSSQ